MNKSSYGHTIKEAVDRQLDLPFFSGGKRMKKSFEEYHAENPKVWEKFKEFSLQAIQRGYKNYSAKGIFEIIRWHTTGEIKGDGFKVNNNYTADYARKFESEFPQFRGFFRKRKKRSC